MTDVTQTCRDIKELLPVAQEAVKLFLEECNKEGLNIFITETYRSQARQDYLYSYGRTREGEKVTWTRNSNHTGRLAWDIAVNKPKDLYDTATLKKAGSIAKGLGITWGGTWTTPDTPHFEIKKDWKSPKPVAPKYPGTSIKEGSKGNNVVLVQKELGVTSDGIYGPNTKKAVIKFQLKNNLVGDGVVGPKTWEIIFK